MLKYLLLFAFSILFVFVSIAQQRVYWSADYVLEVSDFASPKTKIGAQTNYINSSAQMDFSFQMSNAEFMLTKNFNARVSTVFCKDCKPPKQKK